MSQMSTFGQDQCLRMLEALTEELSLRREHVDPIMDELFDKFFRQLEKHSLALNSYNICRAFHCVRELVKLERV